MHNLIDECEIYELYKDYKIRRFLSENNYESLKLGGLFRITNLDLDSYPNINHIEYRYYGNFKYYHTYQIFINLKFMQYDSKQNNYGIDNDIDLFGYEFYSSDSECYLHKFVSQNELLEELKKFKLKGEYVKG